MLIAAVALLGVVGVFALQARDGGAPPASPPARSAVPARAPAAAPSGIDVALEKLASARAEQVEVERNPFAFTPKPPPAAPAPGPVRPPVTEFPQAGASSGFASPPAPQPIALKFIGIVVAPDGGRIAVLTDGRFEYHGREGDIIEGRYRIVKIGEESIQLEHADSEASGRQTIRLSGS
jgi:hypothetical protein